MQIDNPQEDLIQFVTRKRDAFIEELNVKLQHGAAPEQFFDDISRMDLLYHIVSNISESTFKELFNGYMQKAMLVDAALRNPGVA